MSDKDKNQSDNRGRQNGNNDKGTAQGRSETTQREWDKIDKKGQGSGDRPKRS